MSESEPEVEPDYLLPAEEIVGEDGLIHTFIKVSRSDDEVEESSDNDGINLDDEFAMALSHPEEQAKVEDDDNEEEQADDVSSSSGSDDALSSEQEEEDKDLSSEAEDETVLIDLDKKRKRPVSSGVKRFKEHAKKVRKSPPKRVKGASNRDDSDDNEDSEEDGEVMLPQKGSNNLYDVHFKVQVLKYFETHSATKTAAKFGLAPKRVREWKRSKEKIEAESLGFLTRRPRGDNYTIEEKLQAIAFSEQHSIHEAQLLYNVHKRTIEKWKQKKAQMEAIIHEGLGGRKRRGGGGRKPQYTHIEKDLRDWIVALRLQGVTVNYRMILHKAKRLLGSDATSQDSNVPSTITWVVKFLGRHNLAGQLGTTLGEEDPQKLLTQQIPGNNDQNSSNITIGDVLGQVEIPENPNQRNRRTITLDDKVSIIERIQRGETQSNVARALKVAQSTIQTIWTSRNQILERHQDPQRKAKIVHWKKYNDIDNALHHWYVDGMAKNIQIDWKKLVAKAIEFCELFNKPEFKIQANKWAAVFCKKHGIPNLNVEAEPESSVSSIPITQNQLVDLNPVAAAPPPKVPPVSNEKDDYTDFFLTSIPSSVSASTSCENYDTTQMQDIQLQPNFSSHPLNLMLQLQTQPQPHFSSDTTSGNNNHLNSTVSTPVSTIDALKYIGLLRSWVHGNYGTNEESLNSHLHALENVVLKKQLADMSSMLPKKVQFGK